MDENTLNEARTIIAGFLKQRRIELKLSQQELADRCGLARKTINAMEAGRFWLGLKQLLQICEALHLFPSIAEMESDTPIAASLRSNWSHKPKAMTIEDALYMKTKRHNIDEHHN